MSIDGNTVAIGCPNTDRSGSSRFERDYGHVRVFDWTASSSSWVQRGPAVEGVNPFDYASSAGALALDAQGMTLAVGASLISLQIQIKRKCQQIEYVDRRAVLSSDRSIDDDERLGSVTLLLLSRAPSSRGAGAFVGQRRDASLGSLAK